MKYKYKDIELLCTQCKSVYLKNPTSLYLTSYPIDYVMECPKCHTIHFMLWDKVLCTEQEYEERIRYNYNKM